MDFQNKEKNRGIFLIIEVFFVSRSFGARLLFC